jgi:signal transduction histidine kinase
MSDNDRQLKLDLAQSQKRLSERTRERDDMQLKLVKSDERLVAAEKALVANNNLIEKTDTELTISTALLESKELELAKQAAQLAMSALEVVEKNKALRASDVSLAKRTEELERKNRELELMMRQREDFVAAITHDLKSPLLGATRVLEFLAGGQVPADQYQEIISQLLESNREMVRMVFNLLDVYRCDAGSVVPIQEVVDIPALINQCSEQFNFTISDKKLEFRKEIDAELTQIKGDGLLLKRILTNLLSNAFKFSKYEGQVILRARAGEGRLIISVRDSGPGMTDEQKEGVFRRFWQTHKSRESGTGTGLGLYLSKELATAIGGDLSFTTEQNVGSEFTLSIPIPG